MSKKKRTKPNFLNYKDLKTIKRFLLKQQTKESYNSGRHLIKNDFIHLTTYYNVLYPKYMRWNNFKYLINEVLQDKLYDIIIDTRKHHEHTT